MCAILQHMRDPVGHQTLEVMEQARNYNEWIYSLIKPSIKGRVAEVGAGTGTFSNIIANDGFTVTAVDYSKSYLKIIAKKNKKIKTILFDLQAKKLPKSLTGKFDSIVILNVIEHLADDNLALSHLYKMLKKNGNLIVLVPAFQTAFGSMDKNLGHYRRYTKNSFAKLIKTSGFNIITSRYANMLGLAGWMVNSRFLKPRAIPDWQVKIFDLVSLPLLYLEKIVAPPFGLSLICVLEK